jgi:hypothetical protein
MKIQRIKKSITSHPFLIFQKKLKASGNSRQLVMHFPRNSGIIHRNSLNQIQRGFYPVSDLIAVVSFIMTVLGGLAAMFSAHRERQTMGTIVAVVFLISFFINVSREATWILQGACLVAFAMAVLGGGVAILTNQDVKRTGGIITGVVSLATSLVILFLFLKVFPS